MSEGRYLELHRLPSMGLFYGRALLARKPAARPGLVPRPLTVHLPRAVISPRQLDAYRRLFGYAAPAVPWTYPHVLAGPLSAELMLAPEFPFKLAGIIHLRSLIVAERPLAVDEPLVLTARLAAHRAVKSGIEIDLETEITADDRLVWRSVNTVLARTTPRSSRRRAGSSPAPIEIPAGAHTARWHVPSDTGRRYARVSGDYNPIHLFGLTSRWLGFDRPIAHGLWSVARCLVELESQLPSAPLRIEVEFRRPLAMPEDVLLVSGPAASSLTFALHSAARTSTFLQGQLSPATNR